MSYSSIAHTPLKNTFFDLSNLALIKVAGEQANDFLQGQLTNNVMKVTANAMCRAASCNLKGRVLALMDVVQLGETLYLVLPQSLLEKTIKSLSKTAALSRVTLEADTHYQCLGFYLHDNTPIAPFESLEWPKAEYSVACHHPTYTYHLGQNFYIILTDKNTQSSVRNLQSPTLWHQYRMLAGTIEITPASRGLFLPHQLALNENGYISFDKGCYKGQEIVARMHYLGKSKYQKFVFSIQTPLPLTPGLRIQDETQSKILGELLDYCPIGDKTYLVAASLLSMPENICYFEGYDIQATLQD